MTNGDSNVKVISLTSMINSNEFGMTFWFDDEQDLMYCPTFIDGTPDIDNAGYVCEWDDWTDVNYDELFHVIKQLLR